MTEEERLLQQLQAQQVRQGGWYGPSTPTPSAFAQQPQQQPQQGGGGMPGMPGMASQFMGGGTAGGAGTGAATGAAGGGGSGAASSGGSMLGSAGPWAALAAVIVGNELYARNQGRRDENPWTQVQDGLTGKVLEQDMDYYGGKVGGLGGEVLKTAGRLGNPEGTWEWLKDLF